MQGFSAIVWLTLKAALRYRVVQVLSSLLLAAVVVLPLMIKHDGSAQGFTQILLTYTLSNDYFPARICYSVDGLRKSGS